MIQSWQIGVLGVLLVGIALVLMAFGLRRRPPSVPLTGSGILIAISGLALLYAWAFPPGPPACSVSVLTLAGLWILWWLPPSRRRMTSEANIIVDRSPAEVFDYVGNFEN